tara:strand:- start:2356 stop:3339 length:984 start_codon:yes stop_codon:yes gene_type:complete
MTSKKILILTSGGDAPGMNAALRAVVRTALRQNFEVHGCQCGFQGLIDRNIKPLNANSVANCIQRGGTILKSARCEAFKNPETQKECSQYLKDQGFDALIVLGGNGSFQGALKLAEYNQLQVIGIPCTIDNDIAGTHYCIGFDTACNTALQAIDRIRDTALSHDRHFIIEVMGRSSGFLAVAVGVAGGAEAIVIPEFPVSAKDIITPIQNNQREKLTSIIVVAEANQPGHSINIAKEIKELSGIEYKTCILGHIQRGGTPTMRDRFIASRMGYHAIMQLIGETNESKMIIYKQGKIHYIDFPSHDNATRLFDHSKILNINQTICGMN